MSEAKRDRDRATEAFRRWARAGCPGADEIKNGRGSEICQRQTPEVRAKRESSAEDLRACAAVFAELESGRGRKNMPREEIADAVRWVYMADPNKPLHRNEITLRARRAAFVLAADERTVYRWLAAARKMWVEYRYKTCQ